LLRHVTAQSAGVLTFLEPVAGVLLGWTILEQRPGVATLMGGALLLGAGLVVVLLEPAAARVADAPAGVGSSRL
jgi:drug/metabolite transporter (DMT)-like permease